MEASKSCLQRHLRKPNGQFVARALTIVCVSIFVLGVLPILAIALAPTFRIVQSPICNAERALVVTSHPDDETLFFAPSINGLTEQGAKVFLLCVTTGNAHGMGQVRIRELKEAVQHLKIPQERVKIINDTQLQDGHSTDWSADMVADIVGREIALRNIDTVVTFDEAGVTNHRNHKAVNEATRLFSQRCRVSGVNCPDVWELITSRGLRKYNRFMDVLPSNKGAREQGSACYVNRRIGSSYKAFLSHHSQWRWWSHMVFSRYSFVNILSRVEVGDWKSLDAAAL